jgi:antirestriction protein ArdC
MLQSEVERIRNGSEWRAVLSMRQKLHAYSFSNLLLIYWQRPDASMVAGYNKWRDMGRQVRKGERGLAILAPLTKRYQDDDGNTKHYVYGFKSVSVFDVSQTDGEPLPQPPMPQALTAEDPRAAALYDSLVAYAASIGSTVTTAARETLHGAHGSCSLLDGAIKIAEDLAATHKLKTLIHEIAHALMHKSAHERERAEVEAESVAFIVCDSLGIDTSSYSFHYVAHWQGDAEELIKAGTDAVKVADAILAAI